MNSVKVVFPAGSHGHYLIMLLNLLSGNQIKDLSKITTVYDLVEFDQPSIFSSVHNARLLTPNYTNFVNIRVSPKSYTKFLAVSLNRTSGNDIILEHLNEHTYDKIQTHGTFRHFIPNLIEISGITKGDVEIKYLREWARVALFSNMQDILSSTVVDSDYLVDFENFYDGSLIDHCYRILEIYNIKSVAVDNLTQLQDQFHANNRYKNIDADLNSIITALDHRQDIAFDSINFVKQAWIDKYLETKYNIVPKLKNEYSQTTGELLAEYDLW